MLLFVLSLIFAVPLAILANIVTPRVLSAWSRRNAGQRNRHLENLRLEIADVKRYHDGPSAEFIAYIFRTMPLN
jgi:hypothetical protein